MRKVLSLVLTTLCILYPMVALGGALANADNDVQLSNNLSFDGTVFMPNRNEYNVFEAELMPFDWVTPLDIVDLNHAYVWEKTERTQLLTPDVFYENERGDWLVVQKGSLIYLRADARSSVGALANQIYHLTSSPNDQDSPNVSWDSYRNPASDFSIDAIDDTTSIDVDKAVLVSYEIIQTMQMEQEPVLVNCTLTNVGNAEYCILSFGFKYENTVVYGPSEQLLNIVNKDDSMSGTQEYILIVFDQNGICSLYAVCILQRCSDETQVSIMSFDSALASLTSILSYDPDNQYILRQAWLAYLPVGDAYEGNVQFRPYWCFFMEYDYHGVVYVCTARIDATTGEVLW